MTLEVFNEPWHYFGARGEGEGGEGSGGRGDEAEEGVKGGMRREGDAARFREQQGRRLPADVTVLLTPRRPSHPHSLHTHKHTHSHAYTQTVM